MPMKKISITVNGEPRRVAVRPGESLLETLRTRCGVISTKDGCQPQGQCGCCVALVDGLPKTACVVKAEKVDGKSVLTLEGLPQEERDLIARSFVSVAGLQCGFCIPATECGNALCEPGEDCGTCADDCTCAPGFSCVDNVCQDEGCEPQCEGKVCGDECTLCDPNDPDCNVLDIDPGAFGAGWAPSPWKLD